MNNDNDCEMITTLHNLVELARRLDENEIRRATGIITGIMEEKKMLAETLGFDAETVHRAANAILRSCALTLFYVQELKTFYPVKK